MKVTILGKDNCGSCVSSKQLCEQRQIDYTYQLLGKDFSIVEFYSDVPRSHRSFPAILIDGKYIGGLVELKEVLATKYSK